MAESCIHVQATIDFIFPRFDDLDEAENIADIEDRIIRAEFFPQNIQNVRSINKLDN